MSILITGVAGFIGSNLSEYFLNNREKVVGIDNLSRGKLSNLKKSFKSKDFNFVEVDISHYDLLRESLIKINYNNPISEVWHMAANSDIPGGILDSQIDLKDTFLTTMSILRLMKEFKIPTISFASSSAIYGDLGDVKLTEDIGPLFPISNYGAMKLASEAAISSYLESYIEKAFIFRFPNVIGIPATHGVIFDFINKLKLNPDYLEVLGDGTQQKTYLHVEELIDAMIFIRKYSKEKINYFNIGANDNGASVKFIAEEVVKNVSSRAIIKYGKGHKGWVGDVPKFTYSIDKLTSLGWQSNLTSLESVKKAIKEIIENYS